MVALSSMFLAQAQALDFSLNPEDYGATHNQICEQVDKRLQDVSDYDGLTREEIVQIMTDELMTLCNDDKECEDSTEKLVTFFEENPMLYGPAQQDFNGLLKNMRRSGKFDTEFFFTDVVMVVLEHLCLGLVLECNESVLERMRLKYNEVILTDDFFKLAISDIMLAVHNNMYSLSLALGFGFGDRVTPAVNEIADRYALVVGEGNSPSDSMKADIVTAVSSIASSSTRLWTSIPFDPKSSYFKAMIGFDQCFNSTDTNNTAEYLGGLVSIPPLIENPASCLAFQALNVTSRILFFVVTSAFLVILADIAGGIFTLLLSFLLTFIGIVNPCK